MRKLTIPENISLKTEVLPGISAGDTKKLLLFFFPALVGVVIVWVVSDHPGLRLLVLVLLLLYAAVCYAIFNTPDGGQSIYTYLARWIRFLRNQKIYYYRNGKEILYYVDSDEK